MAGPHAAPFGSEPWACSACERILANLDRPGCTRWSSSVNGFAANYLAFVQLASIRLWLRVNESTS